MSLALQLTEAVSLALRLRKAVSLALQLRVAMFGAEQTYVRVNPWPFYLSWGLSFVMIIALSCSDTLRRKYPMNVIFLVHAPASAFMEAFMVDLEKGNVCLGLTPSMCECGHVGHASMLYGRFSDFTFVSPVL